MQQAKHSEVLSPAGTAVLVGLLGGLALIMLLVARRVLIAVFRNQTGVH